MGRPQCELRPAFDADFDTVAEIWHDGASLPGVGPAAIPTRTELRQRLEQEVAAGWQLTLGVHVRRVVGFVAIRPLDAVLAELFVRPEMTGGGIGPLLLDHSKAEMPAGFTLYTRSANAGARRFYEREGLVILRAGIHPRSGDPITFYGWEPNR